MLVVFFYNYSLKQYCFYLFLYNQLTHKIFIQKKKVSIIYNFVVLHFVEAEYCAYRYFRIEMNKDKWKFVYSRLLVTRLHLELFTDISAQVRPAPWRCDPKSLWIISIDTIHSTVFAKKSALSRVGQERNSSPKYPPMKGARERYRALTQYVHYEWIFVVKYYKSILYNMMFIHAYPIELKCFISNPEAFISTLWYIYEGLCCLSFTPYHDNA